MGLRPWDRLDNETDRAWSVFQVYRDMVPAHRSIEEAYRTAREGWDDPMPDPSANVKAHVYAWSATYNWKERVLGYDRYIDRIRQEEVIERNRSEIRKLQSQIIQDAQTQAQAARILLAGSLKKLNELVQEDKIPATLAVRMIDSASAALVRATDMIAAGQGIDDLLEYVANANQGTAG